MRITVFGASDGTELQIVEQALSAGHVVTAFVCTPDKMVVQHHAAIFLKHKFFWFSLVFFDYIV